MRAVESKAGVITFLSGVWLIIAPAVLHFDAADIGFRPYWPAMAVAVVVMIVGMLRALAPLEVPWLGAITFVLSLWLAAAPVLWRDDAAATGAVVNQVVIGTGLVVTCVVTALMNRQRRHTRSTAS
ncbi:hypothetical protein FKR81_19220 [Lentzea tibetensis]|uniref:SPW repeat-containing integral membrane domain-containing protein n=1 Tax=Lentzea tibetensis TaxID=2591470 RepID=A0A563ET78_9PSEU|nr:hypothetical protein [Lentzea tibetensis]TWP50738.1 hypothetical protein FKR81_19220 [Lentzea tibetensis]